MGIFDGGGQAEAYRAINPTGAVPAIRLDDGRVLAESLAILCFLAEGSPYLPDEPFARAKVLQWLSFENDYLQNSVGSLRYWTLTGKRARRPPELVAGKEAQALKVLGILDRALAAQPFIAGDAYTIADMACCAYTQVADEAGLPLAAHRHVTAWLARVRAQRGFEVPVHPYSIDPSSAHELP